ncbi:MAG: T9SS type A sorting domain-containing protein [candidate division Zixibacteria bacterium]|nr:T9SS type A sorting domain-containing protein [candidate division Zixibacteria bacterium]
MRTMILIAIAFVFCMEIAIAGPEVLWIKEYGGDVNEAAFGVKVIDEEGYILAGSTDSYGAGLIDMYLVKTDDQGDTLWTKTYGGSLHDAARAIRERADGGYDIVGSTVSFGNGNFDCWLIVTDENGDSLWSKTFGGTSEDIGKAVGRTLSGDYLLGGYTESYGYGEQYYLIITDEMGDTLWTRTYGVSGDDRLGSAIQTTDGGFILAGSTSSLEDPASCTYLVRTDSFGDTLWTKLVNPDTINWCHSVKQTTDGGYILGGAIGAWRWGAYYTKIYLVKLDSLGDMEWSNSYGDYEYYNSAFCVRQTPDGGYIAVGTADRFYGDNSVLLVRANGAGDSLWAVRYYNSPDEARLYDVAQTPEGDYLAAGQVNNNMVLMKLREPLYCCDMEMTPDDDPVVVQPGGSFSYQGTLINPSTETLISDVWIGVIYEGEFFQTRLFEATDSLQSGEFVTRHLTQNVPNYAPEGDYRYMAYGGAYPYPCDSVWFDFTVEGAPLADGNSEWSVEELFTNVDEDISTGLPSTISIDNSPNPFNAATTITYQLPESGNVNLSVYNLSGQKVATLEDGHRNAGEHSATWDASNYSSGIYFYKLTAGDRVITKRMTLLK